MYSHNERLITYNGQTHNIMEWSRITGIRFSTLLARLNKGWDTEDALNTPVMVRGRNAALYDTNSREYHIWADMKTNCDLAVKKDPDNAKYYVIYPEWYRSYPVFKKWCESQGYHEGLMLVRKDKLKGFGPDNCLFVTREEYFKDYHNKGSLRSIRLYFNDDYLELGEIALYFGLSKSCLLSYLHQYESDTGLKADSVDEIMPYINKNRYVYKGEAHSKSEWNKLLSRKVF